MSLKNRPWDLEQGLRWAAERGDEGGGEGGGSETKFGEMRDEMERRFRRLEWERSEIEAFLMVGLKLNSKVCCASPGFWLFCVNLCKTLSMILHESEVN